MATKITDEIRQAVLLELCEQHGHQYGTQHVYDHDPASNLLSIADDPYIECFRCGRVWLVDPQSAASRAEARRRP